VVVVVATIAIGKGGGRYVMVEEMKGEEEVLQIY
jgi:hypothetical protein